jgi:hypothetical protein
MWLYDDTAVGVLQAAAQEAGPVNAGRYETSHVLLGLLRTGDPVTRTITASHPKLTVDAVRSVLGETPSQRLGEPADPKPGSRSTREPAAEYRRAAGQFTAKWRPLVRGKALQPGAKLGAGELWLTVLEPAAASARVLAALDVEADAVRPLVLAALVRNGAPVPDWPGEAATGGVRRLLRRVFTSTGRR